MIIKALPGPQEKFLSCSTDIALYGGTAGCAKSWGLLLDPLRHLKNSQFKAVIFRRTFPQITQPGGLWDDASLIYTHCKATSTRMQFVFPSGMKIQFAHMQHEKNKFDWQGSQIPEIEFDELTHFSESQFFYMLSRNRSACGIRPYIRASANADASSWVASFIDWWIDVDGYPREDRNNVPRHFTRQGDKIVWSDKPVRNIHGKIVSKSFTFISALLTDNPILMERNPEYLSNLESLCLIDRERLLKNNWRIMPSAGLVFRRGWFEIVDAAPEGDTALDVSFTDWAGTESKSACYTAIVRMRLINNLFYVLEVVRGQWNVTDSEKIWMNLNQQWKRPRYRVGFEREPSSAGKRDAARLIRNLGALGFDVHSFPSTQDKVLKSKAASAQVEAGNIKLVRGAWNEDFLKELDGFPTNSLNTDQVDAFNGAFKMLTTKTAIAKGGR